MNKEYGAASSRSETNIAKASLPERKAELSVPVEARRLNFIFCHHETAEDARSVIQSIKELLHPDLKGQRIVIWHELGCPMNFPRDTTELSQCHAYLKRTGLLTGLPTVRWPQEFARGDFSRSARTAFQMIHDYLRSETERYLEKSLPQGKLGDGMVNTSMAGWSAYYSLLRELDLDGWGFEYRVEKSPREASIDNLFHAHLHNTEILPHLFRGDVEASLRCKARSQFYFTRAAERRDETFLELLREAFDPAKGEIHVIVRGAGHQNIINKVASAKDLPISGKSLIKYSENHDSISSEEWQAMSEQENLRTIKPQPLTFELFGEVVSKLFTVDNGFSIQERQAARSWWKQISPVVVERWLESFIALGNENEASLILGTVAWISGQEEVKSDPMWMPVYQALCRSGIFS